MISVMNYINGGVNKSDKYSGFFIVITNHFPFDEGQDSRINRFFKKGETYPKRPKISSNDAIP